MAKDGVDKSRRRFLTASASVVGGVGAAAAAVPFAVSMRPSARAQAAGAPIEVDIGKLEPGQRITAEWRGKPVWIIRRTDRMVDELGKENERLRDPGSDESDQPGFAQNEFRSLKPEYLVLVGICTHLGCSPTFRPEVAPADLGDDWAGGFFCPCHGSRFDLSGRVFRSVPAPKNLQVPPYRFLSDSRVKIGESGEAA